MGRGGVELSFLLNKFWIKEVEGVKMDIVMFGERMIIFYSDNYLW